MKFQKDVICVHTHTFFTFYDFTISRCSLSLALCLLLGDLLNIAGSNPRKPVSTTTVVGRDFFFGEWMDEVNVVGGGVGVQSVMINVTSRYVSLNACALAAQRNSGRIGRNHSTLTTTNHLKVVAGNYATIR